jgi:hypothetical protein
MPSTAAVAEPPTTETKRKFKWPWQK